MGNLESNSISLNGKVKILHVTRYYTPITGGTETHISNLCIQLLNRGVKNRVLTLNRQMTVRQSPILMPFEEIDGVEVYRIKGIGHYKKPIPLDPQFSYIRHFRWADIIHIHDLRFLFESSILAHLLWRKPLILQSNGLIFHTEFLSQFKRQLFKQYYAPLFRNCFAAVIAISKQDLEILKEQGVKQAVLIENAVNLRTFSNVSIKRKDGEILYFGRIDFYKGLENLFTVLSQKEVFKWNWRLNLVGTGNKAYIKKLQDLCHRIGISDRISWHGSINQDALIDRLRRAQFAVFPSLFEGFGITLIEAMAAGCPCLANNIPTYSDILSNGEYGRITDFQNLKKAVKSLKEFLTASPDVLRSLGERGLKRVHERYDWEKKSDETFNLYYRVLKKGKNTM